MRLRYDVATGEFKNNSGVEVRPVPSFEGMEDLVPGLGFVSKLAPYKPLIETLVKQDGYTRGVDMAAMTYDWRRGPSNSREMFAAMRRYIEDLYERNGNQAVTLVSHSLGCLWTLSFLQR